MKLFVFIIFLFSLSIVEPAASPVGMNQAQRRFSSCLCPIQQCCVCIVITVSNIFNLFR